MLIALATPPHLGFTSQRKLPKLSISVLTMMAQGTPRLCLLQFMLRQTKDIIKLVQTDAKNAKKTAEKEAKKEKKMMEKQEKPATIRKQVQSHGIRRKSTFSVKTSQSSSSSSSTSVPKKTNPKRKREEDDEEDFG